MVARRRLHRSLVSSLAIAGACLLATACSSSDGSPGPQPGPSSSITLVVNPTGATIPQGSVGPFGVSIGRTNYTGNVDVALSGLPAGATTTVLSTQTTPGVTVNLYQLNVAASTAVGTYPISVRASGTGVTDATGTYTLVVTAGTATGSYTISAAPTAYTVAPGGSTAATVTLARSNFTGSVNLSITGAPAGVTATFAPQNTTAATSTMTLNVASSVAPGTYTFSVGGVAAGQPDRIALVTLTVPAAGSYTLAAVPASVTLAQGASTTNSINVLRSGGFAGGVAIAVTGMPAGMTATVTPAATTTNAATLAISAGAATPVGTYTLTVTGTATGLAPVTTTMQVTVTAGGTGGSGNVVFNFSACPATSKPIWLAFQDGNGAWTRVAGSGDVYTFNVAGTRGGVVWVSQASGANTLVTGVFNSRSELSTAPFVLCGVTPTKTVAGIMTGLAAGDQGNVSYGNRTATGVPPSTAFTLNGVLDGAQDVVGYRQNAAAPFANDRILLRRDVNLANGGALGTLDFNGTESTAPTTATFTVPNAGTDQIARGMSYLTGSACATASLYQLGAATGTTFTMAGMPAARQRPTDFHQAFVTAIGATSVRTVVEMFGPFAARTITLPTVPANVQVTSLGGPYKRLQAALTLPSEYGSVGLAYFDASVLHYVTIGASLAYLGSTSAVIGMPDLSAVNGWNNAWAPATNAAVTTSTFATGSTQTGVCSENARSVSVQVNGTN